MPMLFTDRPPSQPSSFAPAGYLYWQLKIQKSLFQAETPAVITHQSQTCYHSSSMDSLLHMWVNLDHLVIKIAMVANHHLGVPGRSHKDGVDAAA